MRCNQLQSASHLFVLFSDRLNGFRYKLSSFKSTRVLRTKNRNLLLQFIAPFVKVTLVTLLFCFTFNVEAQEVNSKTNDTPVLDIFNITTNQIAQKLVNPNNALANLTLRKQLVNWSGNLPESDGHNNCKFLFQIVLPFPFNKTSAIGFKPALSYLIDHPVLDEESGSFLHKSDVTDMSYDLTYGNTLKSGLLLRIGLTEGIPIGTVELSKNSWALGPEIIVGLKKKYGIFLMFASQQWTVPIQVVTSKTVKLGETPLKLANEVNYFNKSNDYYRTKMHVCSKYYTG